MFDSLIGSFFRALPAFQRSEPLPCAKASKYGGVKIGAPDGYKGASSPSVNAVQKAREILEAPARFAYGTEFDIFEKGRHYVARVEKHVPHVGGTDPIRAVTLYEDPNY